MTNQEREPASEGSSSTEGSTDLPPELVAAIKDLEYACVSTPSEQGTVYVIKALAREIDRLRGTIPIQVRHELYQHPAAPVIRTLIMLYDQPEQPFAAESFINVADPGQRGHFAALADQEDLHLLFYDEGLRQRLSKRLRNRGRPLVPEILSRAEHVLQAIAKERLDFDRAKADLLRSLPWPPCT